MRFYTFVFSVMVHTAAIAWVIIAPALATSELPEVQRTTAYVLVEARMPDPIPPPVKRPEQPVPPTDAAPIAEPDGVQPERPVEPVDHVPFDDPGAVVDGPSFGGIPSNGDFVAPPPPPPRPKEPMPVGGLVQAPKKIVHVAPIYPPIAIASRKPGLVILQATIGEDGSVRDVKVLRSDPLFDQSAMDAVRQWRFTRPTLNGQPIPVVMTVTVGFTLNQ